MLFLRAFESLKEMYLHGGIEIRTYSGDNESLVAKTLIQPDGDVVQTVSDRIFNMPDIWDRHLAKIDQRIKNIRRFGQLLKWGPIASIPLLSAAIYAKWTMKDVEQGVLLICINGSVILCFFLLILRPMISYFLRRSVKKF